VQNAFKKADDLCEAAGVKRGPVLHIEDERLTLERGHGQDTAMVEEVLGDRAFSPGSILVGAAVTVAFSILGR